MWIEELPNGKFKYFERYKDPYTEKYRRVSVTLNSKSNQAKKQAMMELQDKINKKASQHHQSDVSLSMLFEEWILIYKQRVKEQTYLTAISLFKAISKRLDINILVKNITSSYIQKFLNDFYYKENYSYSYTDSLRAFFSNIFEYAKQVGIIEYNIVRDVKIEKKRSTIEQIEKISDKYLEPDELKLVLSELRKLKKTPESNRYAEAMEILSKTGLRYGELAALKTEDYDGENININKTLFYNYASLKDGKTTSPKNVHSNRTISLTNDSKKILDHWIEQNKLNKAIHPSYNDMGFLLASTNGNPISPGNVNYALRKVSKKLKQENKMNKRLSTHIFRHTHISQLAELGVNQKAIMQRVGQANPLTTIKIYTHVTKKVESDLLSKLNAKEKEQK
ncbi:TPA: site-specific integrase [Enterococcus faecalis]|nr:site-specific integrase [Enterococcus faecalis]